MRSNEIIRGGDPEDEVQPLRKRAPKQAPERDYNKVYKETRGAASLVMENLQWGVTHD